MIVLVIVQNEYRSAGYATKIPASTSNHALGMAIEASQGLCASL
jgi:hypothetical protein